MSTHVSQAAHWLGVNFAAQLDSLLASRDNWPDATCETFVKYLVRMNNPSYRNWPRVPSRLEQLMKFLVSLASRGFYLPCYDLDLRSIAEG